jgi:hypothetical protein
MKRREILRVAASLAGTAAFPLIGRGAVSPCPPPHLTASGGSSTATTCGPSTAPSWFTAMPDKTWTAIAGGTGFGSSYQNGKTIGNVAPTPSPPGAEGYYGALDDWTGACVSQSLKEMYLPAQGGHNGYYGNEVYCLNLSAAQPTWSVIWGPTPNANISTGDPSSYNNVSWLYEYSDGSAPATHSWDSHIYCDNNGRIWLTIGDASPSGIWSTTTYSIDRNNTAAGWMFHGRLAAYVTSAEVNAYNFLWQEGPGAFDPVTNTIWQGADQCVDGIGGVFTIPCATTVSAGGQNQSTGPRSPVRRYTTRIWASPVGAGGARSSRRTALAIGS